VGQIRRLFKKNRMMNIEIT